MNPAPASVLTLRTGVPRLLVSVRNAEEAAIALSAGVDLLDVKNPIRGSLGRPDNTVVQEIVARCRQNDRRVSVSVALGELRECIDDAPNNALLLPEGVRFAKLGLADMARHTDWQSLLRDTWTRLRCSSDASLRTVAVAYADWQPAEAPPPADVVAVAADSDCAGILIDTCSKQSGGLLDNLSVDTLGDLSAQADAAGLFLAVAGQLRVDDLPALVDVPIDVIAVRSAVCDEGNRTASIAPSRIELFTAAMQRVFR